MQSLCLSILSYRQNQNQYHTKLCLVALSIQKELVDNGYMHQVV